MLSQLSCLVKVGKNHSYPLCVHMHKNRESKPSTSVFSLGKWHQQASQGESSLNFSLQDSCTSKQESHHFLNQGPSFTHQQSKILTSKQNTSNSETRNIYTSWIRVYYIWLNISVFYIVTWRTTTRMWFSLWRIIMLLQQACFSGYYLGKKLQ